MICGLMWLQEQIQRRCVYEKDWTSCWKYDNNNFRLNNKYNWGWGEGMT